MEEVNAALVELEEHEHSASTDKTVNEKHSDTEKPSSRTTSHSISTDQPSILNGSEENGGVHEEIGDSYSESGSETIEPEGHNEDDLDEENHDDGCDTDEEDEDDGPASDEDDEVHVRQKVAEPDPLEVASFDQELRAVVQASFCYVFNYCCCIYNFFSGKREIIRFLTVENKTKRQDSMCFQEISPIPTFSSIKIQFSFNIDVLEIYLLKCLLC